MMEIKKANLKFNGKLTPLQRVEKLVQHHMAHPTWGVHDVHKYHQSKGWIGIGYNYWIAFDGTIYEGRGLHVGAHVEGWNSRTIGIGYQGDFTKQQMTDAQLRSGIQLNHHLIVKYGLTPADIIGHRDLAATVCPGPNFRLAELRQGIERMTNTWTGQLLKRGDRGPAVRDLQNMLKYTGFDPGPIDGVFGSKTEAAVRAAQKAYGLVVDGIAGPKTYAALRAAFSPPKTTEKDGKRYRVLTGTFSSREAAEQAAKRIKETFGYLTHVVDA